MGTYAKFVTSIIGLLVLGLKQFFGISLSDGFEDKLADVIIMVITAIGVYTVPNKQA